MFSIPARLFQTFGLWMIIPFVIITVFAGVLISQLEFQSGFTMFLPEDDPVKAVEDELAATFGHGGFTMIAVDTVDPFSRESLARLAQITHVAGTVPGVASVVSIATIEDLYVTDGELIQRRLYDPDADPSFARLVERVEQTPLFRQLLVSADRRALLAYAIPEPGEDPVALAGSLVAAIDAPDTHFFGDGVMEYFISDEVLRDLVFLGSLALVVVLLIESLIARSFLTGLVLSMVSLVPAIWSLSFFKILGQPVESTTVMVPVIVLVLATSYGIHVFRYHVLGEGSMVNTLEHVAKIVLSAGFTTMVGFVSLVITPSPLLSKLGLMIIFGIAAALVTSLLLLPPLLARLSAPAGRRAQRAEKAVRHGYVARFIAVVRTPPARPRTRLIVFVMVVVLVAVGVPRLTAGYSFRDTFRSRTAVADAVRYFEQRLGVQHELTVYLDTGQEYGLVDPQTFTAIRELTAELTSWDAVASVNSYVGIVEWMLGRLHGRVDAVQPESAAEIGEAMELLSGQTAGLSFDALVDTAWRRTRLQLTVGFHGLSEREEVRHITALIDRIKAEFDRRLPSVESVVTGIPVLNLRHIDYLSKSQLISLVAFVPILIAFLVIVFRSLWWAMLALLPTLAGVVFYFGLISWTGMLHDPFHVFMIAAMMGVSNDDVLYFLFVFKHERANAGFAESLDRTVHRTGMAIIQTTLVIAAGIGVMYLSNFVLLGKATLAVTLSLFFCTLVTLTIVPSILRLSPIQGSEEVT